MYLQVLFDVVPDIKFSHARALLKMCPVPTSLAECMRYDFISATYLSVKAWKKLSNQMEFRKIYTSSTYFSLIIKEKEK